MQREAYFARYGLSTQLYNKLPITEALEKIAGGGFRIVELYGNAIHLDPICQPDIPAIRRKMSDLGIRAHSLHSPHREELYIGGVDPAYRARWREAMVPSLHYTAELGARGMVFHVSNLRGRNDAQTCAEGAKLVTAFVEEELRPLASQLGVHLLLENMTNRGWPRFGTSFRELTDAFPGEDYRFCIDFGHTLINKVDPKQDIADAGSRLMSVHCASNDGEQDMHWLPVDGALDWPAIMTALDAAGYNWPIILEIHSHGDPEGLMERLKVMYEALP
jgi:sugar phosphate isomerase/epimerase